MTFDNVPWVITMKKNDHYFPTMEWIKDPSESSGWRRVTYEQGKAVPGEGHEGVLVGDGGDEGFATDGLEEPAGREEDA
jgi:pro-apoptotic serine protease NMA111